jgi:DNA-binding GntR family transcriptional regulator
MLSEQARDVLQERILRGELGPGEPLVETRIAHELGMSQGPVREALRELELMRLVESEPFKTARVRAVTDEDLLQVFPVRAVLEELAAREAARRPDRDVSAIERALDEMQAACTAGDTRTQLAADLAFHRALVEASGNRALLQSWLALGVEVPTAFGVYWTYFDPQQIVDFHPPILDAVRAGDTRRAALEARAHVRRTETVVRRRRRARTRRVVPT